MHPKALECLSLFLYMVEVKHIMAMHPLPQAGHWHITTDALFDNKPWWNHDYTVAVSDVGHTIKIWVGLQTVGLPLETIEYDPIIYR